MTVLQQVVTAFTRTPHFKGDIVQAVYEGIRHKPDTTLGNAKVDVLDDKRPNFRPVNLCSIIRDSAWQR